MRKCPNLLASCQVTVGLQPRNRSAACYLAGSGTPRRADYSLTLLELSRYQPWQHRASRHLFAAIPWPLGLLAPDCGFCPRQRQSMGRLCLRWISEHNAAQHKRYICTIPTYLLAGHRPVEVAAQPCRATPGHGRVGYLVRLRPHSAMSVPPLCPCPLPYLPYLPVRIHGRAPSQADSSRRPMLCSH